MADHIYCGSGKEKTFADGGSIITVTLNVDELLANYEQYGFTTNAGKRTIKVKVGRRKNVGQYGETHTVEIDTFKPQSTQGASNGNGYQNRQGSLSKPLSGTPEGVPDFDDSTPPDFPDDIPF